MRRRGKQGEVCAKLVFYWGLRSLRVSNFGRSNPAGTPLAELRDTKRLSHLYLSGLVGSALDPNWWCQPEELIGFLQVVQPTKEVMPEKSA